MNVSLAQKRLEIQENLSILKEILSTLQQQQELNKKEVKEVNNIGTLFQKLT